MSVLDDHGQPLDLRWNERRRIDRSIHEMLGLMKGILADGVVSQEDALALRDWVNANPDAVQTWPGEILARRLNRIFSDGMVSDEERQDLQELLLATVGVNRTTGEYANPATALPLDDPPPELVFAGRTYCLTGKFVYGTRPECEAAVMNRGGQCLSRVTKHVDALVIGCLGSRDWIQTSWGRKIEAAMRLRDAGSNLWIVGEEHWTRCLEL